ncbi:MAG: NHLP family bacteriocin export ABC transporter peptidase/permease/ATPase subunit [Desulfovibrionaceae bacterium]
MKHLLRKDKGGTLGFRNRPRGKTPVVLQMEAVECGAAALGSVLAHHGRFVPLSQLREQCGVNRDGSRASNVVRVAASYGMEAKGFRRDARELFESTRLPAVVFWRYNHFLVVDGQRNGTVYLTDPAYGHRTVTDREFERDYSGVVLELTPGPDFTTGGERYNLWEGLKSRISGEHDALWLIVLLSLLLVLPSLAIPVFAKVFVDKVLVAHNMNWVEPLLFAMGLTLLLRYTLTSLQLHYILKLQTKFTLVSSSRFLWHVLQLPSRFFSQRYAPEITQRSQLNEMLSGLLSSQFTSAALNLVLAVFYLLAMCFYDVWLTLFAVLAVVLNVLVLKAAGPLRRDEFMRQAQERGKVDATTMGVLQTMDTVKSQGMEQDVFAFWAGHHAGAMDSAQKLGAISNVMQAAPVLLTGLTTAAILGLGALRVMHGAMTIGELVAFQTLATMLFTPVNQLAALGGTLQDVSAALRRLDDVLEHPVEAETQGMMADDDTVLLQTQYINGGLELRDITFGYSPLDPPLIEHFDLRLAPGSRVALVGGSGSGKSTLAKIAAGLYKPWSGQVLIDGRPREEYAPFVLRDAVQMVDQQIFLFQGTVRENLTLWDPTVPDAALMVALKDACIMDVVSRMPGGIDAALLENGANLSGGQRQCLEIARALVSNPSIVILDESTNALDPIKERMVDFNLRRRGCTCLMVAHRLSTVRDADEIVVMHRGKVVERGTHEQLMARKGAYMRLVASEGT